MKLTEAIQANTKTLFKTTIILLTNGLKNIRPLRTGKFIALKRILPSLQNLINEPGNTPQSAAKISGLVLFLFQVQDLSSVLSNSLSDLTVKRKSYIDQAKETLPAGEEPLEPTIERLLGTQSKNLKSQIQSILSGRVSITRDVFSTNFKKNVMNLNPINLISPENITQFSDQLLQQDLAGLTELVKAVQPVVQRITILRRTLGSIKAQELYTGFFGLKLPNRK